jgi:hypothetical protein
MAARRDIYMCAKWNGKKQVSPILEDGHSENKCLTYITVIDRCMPITTRFLNHKRAITILHRIKRFICQSHTAQFREGNRSPVALTHPEVEYPHKIVQSHPQLASRLLKLVPKKLLEYCFNTTTSSFLGSTP